MTVRFKVMKLRRIKIDQVLFEMAFGLDADFQNPYSSTAYLDQDTGDVFWVYEDEYNARMDGMDPEENRNHQQSIKENPDQYLEIPGLSHAQHHDILKSFLASDWTDNKQQQNRVHGAYFGSIGGWLGSPDVDDEARFAYRDYCEQKKTELAEEFLRSHGIEPVGQ